jgi:hypothetical protein
VPYYFLPITRWLGWSEVTLHDGRISVEAAFHRRELESLAARAGLKEVRSRSYYPAFRIAVVGRK